MTDSIFNHTLTINVPESESDATLNRLPEMAKTCQNSLQLFAIRNTTYGDAIRFGGTLGAVYELTGILGRLFQLVIRTPPELWDKKKIYGCLEDAHNYVNIASILLDEGNLKGRLE